MAWDLQFSAAAIRDLKKMIPEQRSQVVQLIHTLEEQPRQPTSKKLKGAASKLNIYRLRSGDLRIVYQLKNKQLVVLVLVIANRKEVYQILKSRLKA